MRISSYGIGIVIWALSIWSEVVWAGERAAGLFGLHQRGAGSLWMRSAYLRKSVFFLENAQRSQCVCVVGYVAIYEASINIYRPVV